MLTHSFQVSEGQGGLNIVSLRKSYRKRLVIRDVSMHLNRGEVVALLGPNGSVGPMDHRQLKKLKNSIHSLFQLLSGKVTVGFVPYGSGWGLIKSMIKHI